MKKATAILTTVLLLIISCTPQVPGKYIQPDDMEDLLYDYHLSQGYASADDGDGQSDYRRRLYFLAVLKKYGVSEAEFDSSMVYYYSHADRMAEIYKSLEERLDADAQNIGAEGGSRMVALSANGDTANVWSGPRSKVLNTSVLNNRLDFKIVADTSYHANDMLQLYFTSSFLYQEGSKDAVALIAVKYEGDTIVSRYQRVMSSGETRVTINEKNGKKIKEINGFIYLNKGSQGDTKTLRLMVVDNIQLIRFHQKADIPAPVNNPVTQPGDSLRRDSLRKDSVKAIPAGSVDRQRQLSMPNEVKPIAPPPSGKRPGMVRNHDLQPARKVQ